MAGKLHPVRVPGDEQEAMRATSGCSGPDRASKRRYRFLGHRRVSLLPDPAERVVSFGIRAARAGRPARFLPISRRPSTLVDPLMSTRRTGSTSSLRNWFDDLSGVKEGGLSSLILAPP
ncbi:MAG: hypothetical protein ACRDPA_05515, partial [Solirubrobacteraceae bacterium]